MKLLGVSDLPDCAKSIEVEVGKDELASELETIYRRIGAELQIPGFRKGKVPRNVVESQYGDAAMREMFENLVPRAYEKAVDEAGLFPVDAPKFEDLKYDKGEKLSFKAVVQVRPPVPVPTYKGIALTRKAFPIGDEQVEAEVRNLLVPDSTLVDVDRPAALGDIVVFDYKGTVGGAPVADVGADNFPVELGSGRLVGSFEEQLRGLRAGADAELDVPYPEDYHHPKLRGQTVHFTIKVRLVKEKQLPELTDAYAKVKFRCDTVAEFRVQLRTAMEAAARKASEDDLRAQLLTALVATVTFPCPPAMIERRLQGMLDDHVAEARRRGLTIELDEPTVGRLRAQYEPMAREQVKAYLLIDAIGTKESIQADDDDLAAAITRLGESMGQPPERVRAWLSQDDRLSSIRAQLRDDKVIKFLLSQARVTGA